MTAIKIRVGGAWVDSTKVANARIGGLWVPYGPSDPDPGNQSIFTGETPANIGEDGVALSQGVRFKSSHAGFVNAGRWWAGISPPTSAKCAIYRVSDQVQLGNATSGAMTALAWNNTTFTPRIPILANTDYMAVWWTANRYPYTAAYPWPRTLNDLTADAAFYVVAGDLAFPTNTTALNFFCDFVFTRT